MSANSITEGSDELKPCPFCGTEPKMTQIRSNGFMIKCPRCLIQVRQKVIKFPIEWLCVKMIEDWNKRVENYNHTSVKLEVDSFLSDEIDKVIDSIKVNRANFEHIAKTGVINGDLRIQLRQIIKDKLSQTHQ